jgi:hypothetical protein
MTYREDRSALEHRIDQLRHELARLDREALSALDAHARRVGLETELAVCEGAAKGTAPNVPILKRLKVVSPCSEPWSAMVGGASVRRCLACDKDVYRLEAMTAREIEVMVRSTGGKACYQLKRRADGTVITAECVRADSERRLRPAGRRAQKAVEAAIVVALLAGTAAVAWRSFGTSVSSKVDGASHEITPL